MKIKTNHDFLPIINGTSFHNSTELIKEPELNKNKLTRFTDFASPWSEEPIRFYIKIDKMPLPQ